MREERQTANNGGRFLTGRRAAEYNANIGALYDGTLSKDVSVATTPTGETLFGDEAERYHQDLGEAYGWGH